MVNDDTHCVYVLSHRQKKKPLDEQKGVQHRTHTQQINERI